jgi:hypothetical protein
MEFNELKEYYKQVINEVIASDLPDESVQRYAGMIHGILGRETPRARAGDNKAKNTLKRGSNILGALGFRTQTVTIPGEEGVHSTITPEHEINLSPRGSRPDPSTYIGSGREIAPLITHGYRGMRAGEKDAKDWRSFGGAQRRSEGVRRARREAENAAKIADAGGRIPFLFGGNRPR